MAEQSNLVVRTAERPRELDPRTGVALTSSPFGLVSTAETAKASCGSSSTDVPASAGSMTWSARRHQSRHSLTSPRSSSIGAAAAASRTPSA